MHNNLLFHGAALSRNGCAVAFLAHSGGGKSTLACYLNKCGLDYLTDDSFAYDTVSRKISCAYKPVELREEGYRILKEASLLSDDEVRYDPTPYKERYRYYPPRVSGEQILTDLYFLERSPSKNALEPMSAVEKVCALMESLMTPPEIDGEYIKAFRETAALARGRIVYRDMSFVREILDEKKRIG